MSGEGGKIIGTTHTSTFVKSRLYKRSRMGVAKIKHI